MRKPISTSYRRRLGDRLPVTALGGLLLLGSLPLQAGQQAPAATAARVFKVSTAADPGSAFVIGPAENGRCLLLTALHVIRINARNEPLLFQSPSGSRLNLRTTSFTVDEDLDLAFAPLTACKDSLGLPLARPTSIVPSQKVWVFGLTDRHFSVEMAASLQVV